MKKLIQTLKQVGKPTRIITTDDGSQILILPHGGRVLGLYSSGSDENFYWTHTALASADTAKAFYASKTWHNSGGDRTWLAPEADFFFPHFPKLDVYLQQRSLDPGDYHMVSTSAGFRLENQCRLQVARLGRSIDLKITKSFGTALNPLRHERELTLAGIKYAGYSQLTMLELLGKSRGTKRAVGLWSLVQMPHGGEMIFPTYGRTKPLHIFSTLGRIPSHDLLTTEKGVFYRMTQKGEHKISLRAVAICGRIGYVYQTGREWVLIIRNFYVNPLGDYVDTPWTKPDYFGFAVQACNINSQLGAFNELEYHIPAIGHGTGKIRCQDETQVWAFRGNLKQIRVIRQLLLGC